MKRIIIFLIMILSTACFQASGQKYYFKSYSIKDGLAGNVLWSILQDSRGYLWVSNEGGLSRFDGKSFVNYGMNEGLPSLNTLVHYEDNSNILWLSDNNGVFSFDGQKFKNYYEENLPSAQYIGRIFDTKNKKKWFICGAGIYQLQDTTWRKLPFFKAGIKDEFGGIMEMDDGSLLLRSRDSLVVWKNINDFYTIALRDSAHHDFFSVIKSGYHIYVSTWNRLCYLENEKLFPVHDEILKNKRIRTACEDREGRLWVGTEGNGIFIIEKDNSYTQFDIEHNRFYGAASFYEDREGNMWVCSLGKGLVKVTASKFDFYFKEPKTELEGITAFCKTADGKIYFGKGNILVEWDGKKFIEHRFIIDKLTPAHKTAWISQIVCDNKNRLWVATNQTQLFRIENNITEDLTEKFEVDEYYHLSFNRGDSSIYVNVKVGIMRITSNDSCITDTIAGYANYGAGIAGTDTYSNVWLTAGNGKLWFKNSKGITEMNSLLGLPYVPLRKIYCSSKNILWLATAGNGIYRFNYTGDKWMKTLHLTRSQGLPGDMIFDITSDRQNRLWVSTPSGLASLRFNDIDTGNVYSVTRYGEEEGFALPQFQYANLISDNEGNVCYSTISYLACIRANELKEDTIPPQIQIEEATLFNSNAGWSKYTKTFSQFFNIPVSPVLPHDQNDITIKYNAISFTQGDNISYSYQLEGADKNWISANGNTQVTYANLQPGKYLFHVRAKKSSSAWSQQMASFAFIIIPPWWETWWFITIGVLFASGFVTALYRYRLNQILKLQTIRNKIANDLHDDIGSTLNSISIYSQVAQQESQRQKNALEMIGESSRKVIDAMSDIVWTINSDNDSFEQIILRLRSLTYNLLHAKDIEHTFRADERLNSLKLSMEQRRNFYLIFKEALNNLVKYSNATRVSISLTQVNNYITLIIRDNGVGFDVKQTSTGNGLLSMKSRAKEMKAELKIDSEPGSGTNVELKIKL